MKQNPTCHLSPGMFRIFQLRLWRGQHTTPATPGRHTTGTTPLGEENQRKTTGKSENPMVFIIFWSWFSHIFPIENGCFHGFFHGKWHKLTILGDENKHGPMLQMIHKNFHGLPFAALACLLQQKRCCRRYPSGVKSFACDLYIFIDHQNHM